MAWHKHVVGVKLVKGIPTAPLLIFGCPMEIHIQTNNKKMWTDSLPFKKTTYYHKNE
jgi:hypothetical protein